ncbi:nucleoside deaminase [Candidatus Babeliales bacterium]|nr:nucleoside deaminase [Candidatus Babeliales bacterium]
MCDKENNDKNMTYALKQAQEAFNCGEVPIGAIVVAADGTVIGRGYNKVETTKCQSEHAELIAIRDACNKIGDWRLSDCSMYVTLEPCLMCFGLIGLSRIKTVYFGAKSPLFGAQSGLKDNGAIYSKGLTVHGGLKESECIAILRLFFGQARYERGGCETKACIPRNCQETAPEEKRGDN